jgi:hypothetical protein
MRGPRILFVPTLVAILCAPALAQAETVTPEPPPDFSDTFDNNNLGAWRLVDDPINVISVAENNERLEFTFVENLLGDTRAGVAGKLWWFDSSEPFQAQITGHLTPQILGDGTVGFFIQFAEAGSAEDATLTDGVQFEYNWNDLGPYVAYRQYANGKIVVQDTLLPSVTGEGTAYFEYDGAGKLCASLIGYGNQADTICLSDLFPSVDQGPFPIEPRVLVVMGALSDHDTDAIEPDDAWMDDFVIDTGTVDYVPTADDGSSTPDDTGEIDANGDGYVDLSDLAFVLRSGGGGRIAEILTELGFDSAKFSSQQWSKLMTGLYNHRIAPTLSPPPTASERSASISTLNSTYVGPSTGKKEPALPDTGTPDANNDGFVNFADVARVLEAKTATKDRLNEIFDVLGLDPSTFPKKKYWKMAIIPIYDGVILPEFESSRSNKERKKDLRKLFKAY